MAKFIIGGQEYEAPPLGFRKLKKVWPFVSSTMKHIESQSKLDPQSEEAVEAGFEAVETGAKIIAIALEGSYDDSMTAEVILDKLLPREVPGVSASIQELMLEAGLMQSGPPKAPAAAPEESRSTETSTQSSPSSSPPA